MRLKEDTYKSMLEEEHRLEERKHKREQQRIESIKRDEDQRRKDWETYEKCIEESKTPLSGC